MGTSDNFCLRWNDFETNISSSFRELRRDSEFFDVTLCCDNGTDRVGAHKVILAACSPFFRRILGHNANTPNPFLYLKGIQKKELQAILNFMYHGEVNVAQESLNAFLSCAEELAVKGLTTDSKPFPASSSSKAAAASSSDGAASGRVQDAPNLDDDLDFVPPPQRGKQGTTPSAKKTPSASRKREADLSLDPEEAKKIKPEPESLGGAEGGDDFAPDDSYGGADFDDSYGGGGYEDMDESGNMEGSELTKDRFCQNLEGEWTEVSTAPEDIMVHLNVEAAFIRGVTPKGLDFQVLKDPQGHTYYKKQTRKDGKVTWRCKMHKAVPKGSQCRVKALTNGTILETISNYHNHPVIAVNHMFKNVNTF